MTSSAATVAQGLKEHYSSSAGEHYFALDHYVLPNLTTENAEEILAILSREYPQANAILIQRVRDAPVTDQEWEELVIVGGGGDGTRNIVKANYRRAIDLIRSQCARLEEFRSKST